MGHDNRGRIRCIPITKRWQHLLPPKTICNLEPIALLMDSEDAYFPSGILVKCKETGTLASYLGGALTSIDQRKTLKAIEHMERENARK